MARKLTPRQRAERYATNEVGRYGLSWDLFVCAWLAGYRAARRRKGK